MTALRFTRAAPHRRAPRALVGLLVAAALAILALGPEHAGAPAVASAAAGAPAPALAISNSAPRVGEVVTISNTGTCAFGGCTDNLKWFAVPAAGSHFGTQIATTAFPARSVAYAWDSPGTKSIVLTSRDAQSRLCCEGTATLNVTVLGPAGQSPPQPPARPGTPNISLRHSLAFGTHARRAVTKTLRVKSIGGAPLRIAAVTIAAAPSHSAPSAYAITGDTCSGTSLQAGAVCRIKVRFRPTTKPGRRNATLGIASDAAASLRTVALTARATGS